MSQNDEKITFFKKGLNVPVDLQCSPPCRETLARRPKIFRLNVRKYWLYYFRTSFSSKCSAGHVECSFDNSAEKFLTELKYFRWMSENDIKNVSSRNLFFLKVVIWTLRMQFWKPRQKSFENKPEITRSVSQNDFGKVFFFKEFNSQIVSMNTIYAALTTLP